MHRIFDWSDHASPDFPRITRLFQKVKSSATGDFQRAGEESIPFPWLPSPEGGTEAPENPRVAGSIPALSTDGGMQTEAHGVGFGLRVAKDIRGH